MSVPLFDSSYVFLIHNYVFREWIERLCSYVEKYNPDFWWTMPIEKLAGKKLLKDLNLDASEIERGHVNNIVIFSIQILLNCFFVTNRDYILKKNI